MKDDPTILLLHHSFLIKFCRNLGAIDSTISSTPLHASSLVNVSVPQLQNSSDLRVQFQCTYSSYTMLLRLPLELRNMVYHFTYQSPHDDRCLTPDIYGTRYGLDNPLGRTKDPSPIMVIRKSSTGLLRTCKQVHVEATDVLYGANTFTFAETMHPVSPESALAPSRLRRRVIRYGGMNDLLQMADFLDLIGASNRAKIRRIKLEFNVHSLFLGFNPFPTHEISYSAQPLLARGANILSDAINTMAQTSGSLISLEISRNRCLLQQSHLSRIIIISPKRLSSVTHTSQNHAAQYPSYGMFEATEPHGMHAPLGQAIRNLKGVRLICKDMELWDHGGCETPTSCRLCMQIKGFKIMQKEMVCCSLVFYVLD